MLAANKVSSLSEQLSNTKEFTQPLPVLSSYSGFVPNEVFDECTPVEIMVFAVIQYLSFFSIKCTTRNIGKNLNASVGTIKNALNSLSKRRFIEKQENGTYLFEKSNLGAPTAFVDAKELSNPTFGYWFPIETLKSKKITNQEKKSFALIKSLTEQKPRKMDMDFIALKSNVSRVAASRIINSLLSKKLISRFRPHYRSAYTYQTGGQEMSIYKQDLSTTKRQLIEQSNQNDTSKGNQNDTSLSINKSNISLLDIGKEQRASATYKSGQKKSLFFLKEIIDFLLLEVQKTEGQERKEGAPNLDAQYTQACVDGDIEKIQELRSRMAVVDIRGGEETQRLNKAEKTKALLSDYEYCLKNAKLAEIPFEQLKIIGESVKRRVDLVAYETAKQRKMAFCLTFNSFVLDVKQQSYKSKNIESAINVCIQRLDKDSYELNYEAVPRNVQDIYTGKLSPSNENYRNWQDR